MRKTYSLIFDMLTKREKSRFFILIFLSLITAFLEMAGVASILPFLRMLEDPSIIETNRALSFVHGLIGAESTRSFSIYFGFIVLGLILIGLIFRVGTTYALTRFAMMRSYTLASGLLKQYLGQPYVWFLGRHSSDLNKTILSEVDQVVAQCILPAVRIVPAIFLVLFVTALLIVVEPVVAFFTVVLFGGAYGLIFFAMRRPLLRIGEERVKANKDRFHVAQEAMGGLKELKIMGLEQTFIAKFRNAALRMADTRTQSMIMQQIPRFFLESLAFGGIVLMILVLLLREDGDLAKIVPTLGLVAVAGVRLFPALQEIFRQVAGIRFNFPALENVHENYMTLADNGSQAMPLRDSVTQTPLKTAIELDAVSYQYPNAEKPALNRMTMTIPAHSTVALVGGTGAGKTSAVDILLGLLTPDSGALKVDGVTIDAGNLRSWQKSVGYVPQQIFLSAQSLRENIAFGLPESEIDDAAVETAARIANLHEFVMSELPNGYHTHVGERGVRLSGGQRQRIGIARALYHDPQVLVLDEATSALDNITERAVMEAVNRLGGQKTIVMIAHRLSTVQNCDEIFFLEHGHILESGTYEELQEKSEAFRKMAQAS